MIGMLWFDNDKNKSLEQKIKEGLDHYRKTYGQPNTCYINPKDSTSPMPVIPGVEIATSRAVLRNHFYIGVK